MPRQLQEVEVAGLPVWAWTVSWFAAGLLLGMVVAFSCAFSCWKRRERHLVAESAKTRERGYTATSPHFSGSIRQRTAPDFQSKPDAFSGSIADSAGYCNTDSLSVSHWRGGTRALDPVIESESIAPGDLVAARLPKYTASDTEKSPPTSPNVNEEGMTIQLYPTFPGNNNSQASAPNPRSPTQPAPAPSDLPHQISSTGSAGVPSARVTSTGGSTSGGGSAPGGGIITRTSGGNKGPTGVPQHARNISTVSSTGASPEYEEDDLDDDWRTLLEEVNGLLSSKNYTPIRNSKERATVVNSLLVSTSTRDRTDCVRNAAIDMLTFRKMNTTSSSKPTSS